MSYIQSLYHDRRSMMSKAHTQPQYGHRPSAITHKPSMDETEFEEDYSDLEEYSGRRSEDSGQISETTLSSYDELRTPATQQDGFPSFGLPAEETASMKSVEGPVGPHLFRLSQETSQDIDIYLTLSPPVSPEEQRAPPPLRQQPQRQQEVEPYHEPPRTSVPLRTWSPQQVAEWMFSTGFDRSICDTFFINDISGVTLIDLQYDDLKELGISSFGQRHKLWTEIRNLKDQKLPNPSEELCFSPVVPAQRQFQQQEAPVRNCTPETPQEEIISPTTGRRRGRRRHDGDIISPAESASIVAIEQLLPKPHKCSKGENCSKWQKQQKKLARIATEFPNEMAQIVQAKGSPTEGASIVASVIPSVVASSDLLGPEKPKVRLEADSLRTVQSRDPQENVKQFLQFQHVVQKEDPPSPPYEMFPTLSPPKAQQPHANLASLPRLTIPNGNPTSDAAFSPNRTAKPARNAAPLTALDVNQRAMVHDIYRIGSPASEMDIPVTAIPIGPIERDFSSSVPPDMRYGNADIASLIPRSLSRHSHRGPPPLSFSQPFSPIKRSNSTRTSFSPAGNTRSRSHSRPSIIVHPSHAVQPTFPLAEDQASEAAATEIVDDRSETTTTPIAEYRPGLTPITDGRHLAAAPVDPNAPQHQGYMKKRRTRLLRHEWAESHFRLHGTQLSMHKDASALEALDLIDVDDYAVAISANNSKFESAMKRLRLNSGREKGLDPGAFAFQLTPAVSEGRKGSGSGNSDAEAKKGKSGDNGGLMHAAQGKTHHFAVKSQTERIDWMRELMLARARGGKGGEGRWVGRSFE